MSTLPQARDTGRPHKAATHVAAYVHHPNVIELPREYMFNDGTMSRWALWFGMEPARAVFVWCSEDGRVISEPWFVAGMSYRPMADILTAMGLAPTLAPPPGTQSRMTAWLEARQVA